MRLVDRNAPYSIPEWRAWLGLHGIDINDTISVELDGPLAVATVYRRSYSGGRVVVKDDVITDLVRFKIRAAPPAERLHSIAEAEARFFLAGAGLE